MLDQLRKGDATMGWMRDTMTEPAWPGDGGMAGRIRSHDWAGTPLGAIEGWPPALRTLVELMLAAPQLATLAVGAGRVFLYNDLAAGHYGERHPGVLGLPLGEAFPHEFAAVAPFYDRVFAGESIHVPAQPLDPGGTGVAEVFDAYLVPVRDGSGRVVAAYMTGSASGERQRAEAALLESQQVLAADFADVELLRGLAERLVAEDDAGGIYEEILSAAIALARADAGTIQIYDPGTRSLGLLAIRNFPEGVAERFKTVDAGSRTACGIALVTGRRTFVDFADEEADQGCRLLVDTGFQSALAVPLVSRSGVMLGMLNTHWHEARHRPTERRLRFLDLVARQTADLVEQRRANALLRDGRERQAFLLRLSDALRPLLDAAAIEGEACRVLGLHFGVDRAYYVEVDELAGVATVVRDHVARSAPSLAGRHAIADFAWSVDIMRRADCHVVPDTQDSPAVPAESLPALAVLGIRACMGVPLIKAGRLVGALCVTASAVRQWTEAEVGLLREVAERLWSAIERVRSDTALRASEARMALAFRTLPLGIAIIDAAGEITVSNDEMRRFLPTGLIPSRDPGRSERWQGWDADGTVVRPEDFPGARALRGEGVSPGMLMLYRGDDGAETWTEVLSAPLPDASGRIDGAIAVVVDVDRVKRSEEAAQASEERLRQFGEASLDILWIRDVDTLQWTYLTPAFEGIYGLSRHEALTGDNYRNWQDLIVPEDRARAVASIGRVAAGERVTFEFRIRRPVDRQVRWLRNTDFPMHDSTGRVTQIGGVGHDVTELKAIQAEMAASEKRLRTLTEGIPQLVWRSCDNGLWTWCSPQWMAFTGQTQIESHGMGWLDAVHPDDRKAAMQAWEDALPTGMLDVEYRVRRAADGAWLWHRTRSVPVRDAARAGEAHGQITEWLGTTTDIDDLKRLQGEQQVLVAELQHRTRNLLAVVRNVARRSIGASPERDEYDARLAALGRVQGFLSRSPGYSVPLGEVVEAELQAAGDGRSDKVEIAGPAVDLPGESVQAVALALHELATNAVKYGAIAQDAGRLSVCWRIEAGADGSRRLVIDWRESGVVMPAGAGVRQGYGTELITKALPYQLRAETALEFTPDGTRCRIVLPGGSFSGPVGGR